MNMKEFKNKVVYLAIYDCGDGTAEVKDVTDDTITIQWVTFCRCYTQCVFSREILTELETYDLSEVATIQLETDDIDVDKMRQESLLANKHIFEAFDRTEAPREVDTNAYYVFCDFDGHGVCKGPITEVHSDHVIMHDQYSDIWLDNDDFGSTWFISEEEANEELERRLKNV